MRLAEVIDMADLMTGWYSMSGDTLLNALRRCEAGEPAEDEFLRVVQPSLDPRVADAIGPRPFDQDVD